ncbi:lipopolysaccharide biosynthesis protein [Aliagarivorans marinus]|uniref:lipopolysaccharide biosynthesis protein n=1 Tax=Aliagarivorans marinus TaxID=561965 RepID=UPI00040F2ED9|nr:oligosaccharide flippase family protein [Aliagarivorans marinus]
MLTKLFKSDISIYFIGSLLGKLVGFVMLPIYTSLLTPEDYGVIGLMVISLGVFEAALGARVAHAVPKFVFNTDEQNEKLAIVSSALSSTLVVGALVCTLFYASSQQVSAWVLGDIKYTHLLQWYSLNLLFSGLEGFGMMYLRLHNRARLFVAVALIKLLMQLGFNILLVVYLRMGVLGVVYSGLVANGLLALAFTAWILRDVGMHFRSDILRQLFVFCWPLWLSGLAMLYMTSTNQLFIRYFSSLTDVGLFALAMRFISLIALFTWTPFSNWWQTERFKIYKQDPDYQNTYRLIFHRVTMALFFMGLGTALFSGLVIEVMADEAFHDARYAVAILAVGASVQWLTTYCFTAFFITGTTSMLAKLRYVHAAVVTALLVIFVPLGGFLGGALAVTLSELIMFSLTLPITRKLVQMGVSAHYVLTATATLVGCILINEFVLDDYSWLLRCVFALVMLVVGSLSLYLLGCRSLGQPLFKFSRAR